ncbi:hypothetical protein [Hyalangium gracile]|uniref:hypothetical protein n=1 Tax=Hyalangium gracile TaxID=394092 RepID=UPI001CD032EA|nr:hypothetical protein [Hyalangium gracile]
MNEKNAEIIPWTMTLEQCHDGILQCLMQGTAGHYRIGLLYNHIVARRLAVNRGYRTTREYFRRHVRVLSQSTLTMYGAVARAFPLAVCEKYGMASLGALLEYLRLAHIWIWHIDRKEPGSTPIEIPRRGGLQIAKPFADCTADDLRAAIQARRAWPGHGKLEPEEAPVESFLETLKRFFQDNTRFPPRVDAQVHNRQVHLRIRYLRVWELGRLIEALRLTFKPSAPASPEVQPAAGAASSLTWAAMPSSGSTASASPAPTTTPGMP